MDPIHTHTDIVASLKDGQPQALDELFNQYYRALVYFALRIIKNHEEAEDIVIESFSKLWNNRERMESLQNIKGFLYLTTRNACINELRSRKKIHNLKEELHALIDPVLPDIALETFRAETLRYIYEEMEKLPQQCMNVFKLSVIKGLKSKDIAHQLNISVSNVTSQKSRAIRLLRTALVRKLIHIIITII